MGIRHVWVRPPFTPVEWPGLVLAWQYRPDGWFALVMYVERDARYPVEWVPSDRLRPAGGDGGPRTRSAYG